MISLTRQVRALPIKRHSPLRFYQRMVPRPQQSLPINYGIRVVPQQKAWVVERLGRYHRTLDAGLRFLIPVMDRITYVHSLKEEAISIPNQTAITMDNVTIEIDGVLYIRVKDPAKASYGVDDVYFAVIQLAQTTMRSELGKITLDKTFAERESLNSNIVSTINDAADAWGIECLRYEIRDITPPSSVKLAMDKQAEAERRKRATILDSEGQREAEINRAEGLKRLTVLQAEGEADALLRTAQASSKGIELVGDSIKRAGGKEAVSLKVAEQYMTAFGNIAKEGTTVLLPADTSNPANMVGQALGVFKALSNQQPGMGGGSAIPASEVKVEEAPQEPKEELKADEGLDESQEDYLEEGDSDFLPEKTNQKPLS